MFWTVVLALLALVAIASFVVWLKARAIAAPRDGESEDEYRTRLRRRAANDEFGPGVFLGITLAFVAAFAATLFWHTFVIVQGYEVGVPIAFGNVGEPMAPGPQFVAPWVNVETFPTRPLAVPDVTINARTSQAGSVSVVAGARWSVVAKDARTLYFQVRTGDEDYISASIVDKALGQTIGNTFAGFSNSDAVSDRAVVEAKLKDNLSALVAQYGIRIDSLFLRSVEPDAKTSDSIARLAAQQRDTQIAVEAQNTARAEALRRQIEAQGLVDAAKLVSGVTPAQVSALCLQAWERMQTAATNAHVPLYTNPCVGLLGSVSPVAAVK
jgi:regulator of protease activity HflC (stomatin/prohibitin superfamily)